MVMNVIHLLATEGGACGAPATSLCAVTLNAVLHTTCSSDAVLTRERERGKLCLVQPRDESFRLMLGIALCLDTSAEKSFGLAAVSIG